MPIPSREGPSAVGRGAGGIQGLAQLATDGKPAALLPAGGSRRGFATFEVPLDTVRDCADRLRLSVPVMLRASGAGSNDGGNLTGAVILDVPARDAPLADLRDEVCRLSAALRTPTRALGSRWVMATALRAVPHAGRRWFTRTVYDPKYFQAILSNMPGPGQRFTLAGGPVVTDAEVLDAREYVAALQQRLVLPS